MSTLVLRQEQLVALLHVGLGTAGHKQKSGVGADGKGDEGTYEALGYVHGRG